MKKQLVFNEFVKACYEYGNFLADMKIRCHYFTGSADCNGGYEHFSMYLGCADGAEVSVSLDEREPEVLLRVFKNGKVDGEYKHTRFAEEHHTDLKELFESIEKHVDLHDGFKKKYRLRLG